MSKGYIFLGVDDTGKRQNIECAYALSLSLKLSDPGCETCVVVNKFDDVPRRYEDKFDYIVELPFGRTEVNHHNILIDFWQIYYCTPFDESMFVNTHSLAIDNIESLWEIRNLDDIVFASALDYRSDPTHDHKNFLVQERNNIPAFRSDLIYFNKGQKSSEFFKLADPFFKNWRDIYRENLSEFKANDFDFTLMTNIVAASLDEDYQFPKYFDYTALDIDFLYDPEKEKQTNWIGNLNVWITNNLEVKVNNHRQTGILYYNDPKVMTAKIIEKLDDHYRKKTTKIKA